MKAGMNCLVTVWRLTHLPDDAVGGAVVTGTIVHTGVQTRLDSRPVHQWEQMMLSQGYETNRQFSALIVPAWLDIQEKDELEITAPVDHIHFGEKFRVLSVEFTSINIRDPKNYIQLSLERNVKAHTIQ